MSFITPVTITVTSKLQSVPLGTGGVAWTIQVEDTNTLQLVDSQVGPSMSAVFNLPDGEYEGKAFRSNSLNGVVGDVLTTTFTVVTTSEDVLVADTITDDVV